MPRGLWLSVGVGPALSVPQTSPEYGDKTQGPQHYYTLAEEPWTAFNHVYLGFLVCKVGIVSASTP